MSQAEWYFDFISPYSYMVCEQWHRLPHDLTVHCRPVLLAGLLRHWGHKGPAEIPPKRVFIYRHLQWLCARQGIPLRFPAAHPFNPLPLLRLATALGDDIDVIRRLFRFVWRDGHLPDDREPWQQLLNGLHVADVETLLQSTAVKQRLRDNGEQAASLGVFGVPTFVTGGQLFWGADALDFFLECLRDPELLNDPEMQRISRLPMASARRD